MYILYIGDIYIGHDGVVSTYPRGDKLDKLIITLDKIAQGDKSLQTFLKQNLFPINSEKATALSVQFSQQLIDRIKEAISQIHEFAKDKGFKSDSPEVQQLIKRAIESELSFYFGNLYTKPNLSPELKVAADALIGDLDSKEAQDIIKSQIYRNITSLSPKGFETCQARLTEYRREHYGSTDISRQLKERRDTIARYNSEAGKLDSVIFKALKRIETVCIISPGNNVNPYMVGTVTRALAKTGISLKHEGLEEQPRKGCLSLHHPIINIDISCVALIEEVVHALHLHIPFSDEAKKIMDQLDNTARGMGFVYSPQELSEHLLHFCEQRVIPRMEDFVRNYTFFGGVNSKQANEIIRLAIGHIGAQCSGIMQYKDEFFRHGELLALITKEAFVSKNSSQLAVSNSIEWHAETLAHKAFSHIFPEFEPILATLESEANRVALAGLQESQRDDHHGLIKLAQSVGPRR